MDSLSEERAVFNTGDKGKEIGGYISLGLSVVLRSPDRSCINVVAPVQSFPRMLNSTNHFRGKVRGVTRNPFSRYPSSENNRKMVPMTEINAILRNPI